MKKQTISVIMPALNEERNIESAIFSTFESFRKFDIEGEIIVVNDGSTDNTRNIIESIFEQGYSLKIINHETPKGIGYSFLEGLRAAEKEFVVMFPGDNENDPEEALKFFHLMEQVDIIVPFIHNIEVRDRKRRFISSIYRFIINMSFGINLNYTNGTVFYRKALFEEIELKNTGFFYQVEILIKLIRRGYLFAEVPNYLKIRNSGQSKALTMKSLMNVIKGYLALVHEIHILRAEKRYENIKNLNIHSRSYQKSSLYNQERAEKKEVINV